MRYRACLLPFVLMFAAAVTTACGSSSSSSEPEAQVSNYSTTSDAGGGGDGSNNDVGNDDPSSLPPVTIAPYVVADVTSTPKMRWSIDNNVVTEGYEPKLQVAVSEGTPRRYEMQAFTPIRGGKPAVVIQFGRGQEIIQPGDYDCATSHAVVLMIDANSVRHMTAVTGGAPRACKIHVDVAQDLQEPSALWRSIKRVTGRFEATVGLQNDAASPTHSVRGAFAALVAE